MDRLLFMRRLASIFGLPGDDYEHYIRVAREPVSYPQSESTTLISSIEKLGQRMPGPSSAPRRSNIFPHVSADVESSLSARYRLIAPVFPGFSGILPGPGPKQFSYTFDHLAQVTERSADRVKAKPLHSLLARLRRAGRHAHGS